MNLNLFADSPVLRDILSNPLTSILPGGPKIPPGLLKPRRKRGGAIADDIIKLTKDTIGNQNVLGSLVSVLGPVILPILIKKGVDAFNESNIKKELPPGIDDIINQVSTKTLQEILDMQPDISTASKSILDRVIGEGIAII